MAPQCMRWHQASRQTAGQGLQGSDRAAQTEQFAVRPEEQLASAKKAVVMVARIAA